MHSWKEAASCSFELLFPMLIDLSIQPTKRSAQLDIQRYFSSVDGTRVLTPADQLKNNLKALCAEEVNCTGLSLLCTLCYVSCSLVNCSKLL